MAKTQGKTQGNVSSLIQQLGSAKKVASRLGIKGVGEKTVLKAANGEKLPAKFKNSIISKAANLAKRVPEEQKAEQNKAAAKKLGLHKERIQQRTGITPPTKTKTVSIQELQKFNTFIESHALSKPQIHKITGLSQADFKKTTVRNNIDPDTIRYEKGKIVSHTKEITKANGHKEKPKKMVLAVQTFRDKQGKITERIVHWTSQDTIDRYEMYRMGDHSVGSDVWDTEGFSLDYQYLSY
jgi:hypothetical protein